MQVAILINTLALFVLTYYIFDDSRRIRKLEQENRTIKKLLEGDDGK